MLNKRTKNIYSLFGFLMLLIVTCVFGCYKFIASYNNIQVNYDAEEISVSTSDMSYLQRYCDTLTTTVDTETNTKQVSGTMLLSGSCLDNITYAGDSEDSNVTLTFESEQELSTNSTDINLNFDFEEYEEEVEIPFNTVYDEDGNATTTFNIDGTEYNYNDELDKLYDEDGINECFFFTLFTLITIAITVYSVVTYAIDVFSYLTAGEVTALGLLFIACEGLLLLASGGTAGVITAPLKAAGKIALQSAKTTAGKYLTKSSYSYITTSIAKKGTTIVANSVKQYASHGGIVGYFNKMFGKKAGTEVHHIVEQRTANLNRFGKYNIHSTGNTVRIPEALHQKITNLYNSNNTTLFKQITGKNVGTKSVREYVDSLDFDDQYSIGWKIINYFNKNKTYLLEKF